MKFRKYQHIEKYGSGEVEDIELGECYVFPKIDGTNSSVWNDNGEIKAGSRNRELSLENDNAGFYSEIIKEKNIRELLTEFPNLTIFGEWLVPHTLKTYKENAWRKFYVFDIMDENGTYLHYNHYKLILERFAIEYIPPVCIVNNGNYETFLKALEKNNYLISDGNGIGEGVVIKRYDYKNKYGRQTWAKIVTSEFKEKHIKNMGAPVIEGEMTIERKFIEEFCTLAFIEKEYAKIKLNGWNSQKIPQLLGTIFNTLIAECTWEAIKKYKYPKIDYKLLNKICIEKIKKSLPEIF